MTLACRMSTLMTGDTPRSRPTSGGRFRLFQGLSMGKGIKAAGAGIHAEVLDDFKDQLLVVFLKRLADKDGHFSVSVAEVDDTGGDLVSFSVIDRVFNFTVSKKS